MSSSLASMTASSSIVRERSRRALSLKQVWYTSALTSHGWPRDWLHTAASAASVNACPVSSVCWPSSARTSASSRSPRRSDSALMLKALPPAMISPADSEWMR